MKYLHDQIGSVKELRIGDNSIGNDGLEYITTSLKHNNNNLTCLDLKGNNISNEGIENLSKSLTFNTTLTSLNLSWNKLEGQYCLVDLFKSDNNIIDFKYEGTGQDTYLIKEDIEELKIVKLLNMQEKWKMNVDELKNGKEEVETYQEWGTYINLLSIKKDFIFDTTTIIHSGEAFVATCHINPAFHRHDIPSSTRKLAMKLSPKNRHRRVVDDFVNRNIVLL
eukprot:TRINITY_DN348_c1_g1_i4.p1 TRINITY_DN348_c1_g1~~TRINITY_DN348_c1_g1_i4.p1  ORF type:complete len:223 (+),score=40.54 TRINITY_DN348_c1_g1_i4:780-1448(+)